MVDNYLTNYRPFYEPPNRIIERIDLDSMGGKFFISKQIKLEVIVLRNNELKELQNLKVDP